MWLMLGNGRSTQAAARHLKESGEEPVFLDGTDPEPLSQIAWDQVTAAVQSPGIPPHHPLVTAVSSRGIRIYTDLDLYMQAFPGRRYIGVTGTNGKSTTTALITHMLIYAGHKACAGANFGTAVFDMPDLGDNAFYVLELSSYQLALSMPLKLEAAVWLNLSPDHLEWHGTPEAYAAAKERIFLNAARQVRGPMLPPLPFDIDNPVLRGEHNLQNMQAAYAVGSTLGLDDEIVCKAFESFEGLPHRQEPVASRDSILFINDSKATNADAAARSLKTFIDDDIYWIAGGRAKTDGIDPLAPFFARIKRCYLIGEATERFTATLEGHAPYTRSGTLENAVAQAYADALADGGKRKKVILLAPACASWDQFRDYEQRGDMFREYARALLSGQ